MGTTMHLLRIMAIANRAERENLFMSDRLTFIMDMEFASEYFALRLDDLLAAQPFDFRHDVVGIQRSVDREATRFKGTFRPRFSGMYAL